MLNDYHLQLLRVLVANRVRFLIIGGQARALHYGRTTRDLDLWVGLKSSLDRSALERSLIEWATRHPMHTRADMAPPLLLKSNLQIKFPEDTVAYLDDEGVIREIGPDDGADILTSIKDADFDAAYCRGVWVESEAGKVRYLAAWDVDSVSPLKGHKLHRVDPE